MTVLPLVPPPGHRVGPPNGQVACLRCVKPQRDVGMCAPTTMRSLSPCTCGIPTARGGPADKGRRPGACNSVGRRDRDSPVANAATKAPAKPGQVDKGWVPATAATTGQARQRVGIPSNRACECQHAYQMPSQSKCRRRKQMGREWAPLLVPCGPRRPILPIKEARSRGGGGPPRRSRINRQRPGASKHFQQASATL